MAGWHLWNIMMALFRSAIPYIFRTHRTLLKQNEELISATNPVSEKNHTGGQWLKLEDTKISYIDFLLVYHSNLVSYFKLLFEGLSLSIYHLYVKLKVSTIPIPKYVIYI